MKCSSTVLIISIIGIFLFPGNVFGMILKIATLSPDGSVWMQKMRTGAEEIAQKTNQRVRIKFYPGGVMGDDKAVLRKIRIGQLQGGAIVAGSLSEIYPDIQIYSLPMKFMSFEEVDYVRQRMDRLIIEGLQENGFVSFGLAEGGFAFIMSNEPIQTIGELRKKKVWAPDNDVTMLEAVKAFGITPIPLSIADVRAGLQTGLIDTVTISPIGAIALQWHTQVKYLVEVPLLYVYGLIAIHQKAFFSLSEPDQTIVKDVMGRIFQEIDRQNRKDNVKALKALQTQGIQFVIPSSEALNEWYQMASKVSTQLINKGRISQNMINRLDTYLTEYRSQDADTKK